MHGVSDRVRLRHLLDEAKGSRLDAAHRRRPNDLVSVSARSAELTVSNDSSSRSALNGAVGLIVCGRGICVQKPMSRR